MVRGNRRSVSVWGEGSFAEECVKFGDLFVRSPTSRECSAFAAGGIVVVGTQSLEHRDSVMSSVGADVRRQVAGECVGSWRSVSSTRWRR